MTAQEMANQALQTATQAASQANQALQLALSEATTTQVAPTAAHVMDPFLVGLTVLVLACFVGYYVVWRVTPALHSPLMAVTNAISSVIIVGALLATGLATSTVSQIFGFLAIVLASINIFGGFIVTERMLAMFKKNKPHA